MIVVDRCRSILVLRIADVDIPEIGGGSTSAEGPKKEGRSLLVVTGVFRSPGLSLSFES